MSLNIDRRDFLGLSAASLMSGFGPDRGLSAAATAKPSTQGSRPNLVLFMPDEMRADSLSGYGNPICKTPNFDRLAQSGTRFRNCHVQFPVCGASRCSLLTGWPTSVRGHRSLFYFLRPEEPNLFRYLRRAGYDVFWFGKNDALAAQSFYDSVTAWSGGSMLGGGAGPKSVTPGIASFLHGPGGARTDTNDYRLLRSALEILERKEADRPVCIFLPMGQPHPPYTVPADFYNQYSAASLPPLVPAVQRNKPLFHERLRKVAGWDKLPEATLRKIRAVYYGQVSYSDWLMGELLESLERTGRDRDTAVFLLSDHGDYSGDFGLVEKWPSGLEDCLTHVPLIARVPGGKQGVDAHDMVELYDVMQTCLDLAGTAADHTHFSRSLLPQINGGAGDPKRAAFAEGGYNVYEPQCFEPLGDPSAEYSYKFRLQNEEPRTVSRSAMVRTRDHKLITRPQGQWELYSYSTDPNEEVNLAGLSSTADVQRRLETMLLEHFVNTTGIAPRDKDQRMSPPDYPTRQDIPPPGWQSALLD